MTSDGTDEMGGTAPDDHHRRLNITILYGQVSTASIPFINTSLSSGVFISIPPLVLIKSCLLPGTSTLCKKLHISSDVGKLAVVI